MLLKDFNAEHHIGDERPCQRCIKRGLADACQDGVRKKAKYLHDAPPEALRPVLGPTYGQIASRSNGPTGSSASDTSSVMGGFFPQAQASPNYPMYTGNRPAQMPPPLQENLSYNSQNSPMSTNFVSNDQTNSIQGIAGPTVQQTGDDQNQGVFNGSLFDPSNPALFNFDLEGLNFGNHYGALEFGMLGHMSSGAAETPATDKSGSISQQGGSDMTFNTGAVYGSQFGQMFPQQDTMVPDFGTIDRQNSGSLFTNGGELRNQHLPHAYAIAAGPASLASPSTDASPQASGMGFDSSPTGTPFQSHANQPHSRAHHRNGSKITTPRVGPQLVLGKRTRDPSSIYDTVKEPYSYTTGFHSLTAFIQRRFSPNKTLRIAKALASIRPSFISCTKTLNRQDLIFMEKCFQRTLFEYEDFMIHCCTPTLVCRRTGEIAAVNKEFCMLTGWKKDVLLGKEANLNVNTGRSANDPTSGNSSAFATGKAGLATPRNQNPGQEGRPQPVFLAELLDDDSVIEFYEDFAKLAFGDSRGSVNTRCRLLKYQTKDPNNSEEDIEIKEEGQLAGNRRANIGPSGPLGGRISRIDGSESVGKLEKDGKMDCTYCWTVKRDVFDIPMLIVMNVSSLIENYVTCGSIMLTHHDSSYHASKRSRLRA